MTKTEARTYFRQQRTSLSEADFQRASQELYARLIPLLEALRPQAVHCFLPILQNKEVNTWPVIEWLHRQDIRVVVSKSELSNNHMRHYELSPGQKCIENKWGIPEPVGDSLVGVAEHEIDMVLVPLLAFDEQGNRVGYGKGYYDVFLSKCLPETSRIGLSFFPPISEISGLNPLDIRLTHAVTPDKVWDFTDSKH